MNRSKLEIIREAIVKRFDDSVQKDTLLDYIDDIDRELHELRAYKARRIWYDGREQDDVPTERIKMVRVI